MATELTYNVQVYGILTDDLAGGKTAKFDTQVGEGMWQKSFNVQRRTRPHLPEVHFHPWLIQTWSQVSEWKANVGMSNVADALPKQQQKKLENRLVYGPNRYSWVQLDI